MKRLLTTSAAALLLAAGMVPAVGQSADRTGQSPDSAQSQNIEPEAGAKKEKQSAATIEFVSTQGESDWLASSLLGREVQNASGETLGDISDVIFNQNGQVETVLIGVGGFLGIGEKLVGVSYGALEFKEREINRPAGTNARENALRQSTRPPSATGGNTGRMAEQRSGGEALPPRKDADHSDMVIVLNATTEQLESAPPYMKIGETKAAGDKSGTGADTEQKQPKDQ